MGRFDLEDAEEVRRWLDLLSSGPMDEVHQEMIAGLSDEQLVYYYGLLSDRRHVTNVPALPAMEAEILRRKLPIGGRN